ncbi:MAG: hypothetical protein WD009_03895, partial [Phycisphaeraceae bacterium]
MAHGEVIETTRPFDAALARVAVRRRRWDRAAAAGWSAAAWALAVMVVLLADAAWGLSAGARVVLGVVLVGGLVAIARAAWRGTPSPGSSPKRGGWIVEASAVARELEREHGLHGDPLRTAVALAADEPINGGPALNAALRHRCAERAAAVLRDVDVTAHPRAAAMRPLGALWAIVCIAAVAAMLHPGLFTRGATRLARPMGDTPAYGLTQVNLALAPGEARIGDDVQVTAHMTGRPITAATFVELDDAGRTLRRWPMRAMAARPSGSDTFEHRLRRLDGPVRFRIDAGDGRGDEGGGGEAALTRVHVVTPSRPAATTAARDDEALDPAQALRALLARLHAEVAAVEALAGVAPARDVDLSALAAALARVADALDAIDALVAGGSFDGDALATLLAELELAHHAAALASDRPLAQAPALAAVARRDGQRIDSAMATISDTDDAAAGDDGGGGRGAGGGSGG